MSESITYEQDERIGVIRLDDGKANAFNLALIAAFHAQLDHAEKHAQAIAIVGREGILSGGFDLGVIRGGDDQKVGELVNAGARLLMRLYGFTLPVIVVATGHAVALGAFLLLCADVRIGTRGEFTIGLNETAAGLTLPEFGLVLARARLSPRYLSEATIGATLYKPEGALEVGYVDELVAADVAHQHAMTRAKAYATLDGTAFAASKHALRGAEIAQVLDGLA